ncbi:MAG: hypothetical protein P1P90_03450 [Patescibacteria group bacterium]|nr:hypothetical protein [Patescibacteria group bacterium]
MVTSPFKVAVHNYNGELTVNLLGSITREEYEKEMGESAGELMLFVEIPFQDPKNYKEGNPLDVIDDAGACWEALLLLSSTEGMCSALEDLLSKFANHLVVASKSKK